MLAVACILKLRCVLRLLVTANIPSWPVLLTLMMEATWSSEPSVLTRVTWHNIPEEGILHFSDSLPIHNCIKQGAALSPLLFNFVQNMTHQFLA
jgi:hypothetical protein